MSEQIDWSKAPEGATHYNPQCGDWYMVDSDCVSYWSYSHRNWLESAHWNARRAFCIARPTTPSWSGEGLPPVGVVCMANGYQVVIVAHHCNGIHAIYAESEVDGLLYYGEPNEFRPIRTHEQIAADEREAAVDEMHKLYMEGAKHSGGLYAIYDAGYRKP